jgi:hypothetical protein
MNKLESGRSRSEGGCKGTAGSSPFPVSEVGSSASPFGSAEGKGIEVGRMTMARTE